jgi:hypothetical protein
MHAFKTARLSRSKAGGKVGRLLWGLAGSQGASAWIMVSKYSFIDVFSRYVDGDDMSKACVFL